MKEPVVLRKMQKKLVPSVQTQKRCGDFKFRGQPRGRNVRAPQLGNRRS